tara:strand:- start:144 stop:578 length:435 start_codon:yes stop_codon:yes gene_type:complete
MKQVTFIPDNACVYLQGNGLCKNRTIRVGYAIYGSYWSTDFIKEEEFNYSCDKELTFAGDIIEDGIYRYTPTLKLWSFRLNEKIDKLGTSARKPTVEEWFTLFTAEQRQECINQNAEYEADRAELIERLNEWEEKKRRNLINKL